MHSKSNGGAGGERKGVAGRRVQHNFLSRKQKQTAKTHQVRNILKMGKNTAVRNVLFYVKYEKPSIDLDNTK